MFDVCVVGHITRDIIRVDGKVRREIPGGTVYYTSMALQGLGLRVAAVTTASRKDEEILLGELRDCGVSVFFKESEETTVFENIYTWKNPGSRLQRVKSTASPLSPEDLSGISAALFHLGPLTNRDISHEVLEAASVNADLVSLDGQGFLRKVTGGKVTEQEWQGKEKGLACVDILKVDEREATLISGENNVEKAALRLAGLGPREVIITRGSRGALVLGHGSFYEIPALEPRRFTDPTGCGDTFVAGYIWKRLRSTDLAEAGRFGAFLASLKLERFGALKALGSSPGKSSVLDTRIGTGASEDPQAS
ncbi:MAG: ribokinase [Deltaproteobacteria bacterium]|nr:ribokinase [Deltaproteobacteria bacterium]